MNILLDECVPWPMHKLLSGHDCTTAQRRGWGGITNGDLLRLAEAEFNLIITSDQGIQYQQKLTGRHIAIIELSTNKLHRIEAAADLLRSAVGMINPGDFRRVESPCAMRLSFLSPPLDELGQPRASGETPRNFFHA